MMNEIFISTMLLTFKLAFVTTVILLILGTCIAYYLFVAKSHVKPLIETIVSMPLVLPPTVLGFYLLVAFSQENFLGRFLQEYFGFRLTFTFAGLVFGSVIFSLPFMVHPIQNGLAALPKSLSEAATILGKSKVNIFFKILLPNIKPSLLTGVVITFAHTIGEFGVVLMIGGNIPQKTRVASLAIYDQVESLNYHEANKYALTLFVISFCVLLLVYIVNKKYFAKGFR